MSRSRDEEIDERAAHNMRAFMEKGPGLRYSTKLWVVARDRAAGWYKLGGLGSLGVGEMWFKDDGHYTDDPTYADAPEETHRPPWHLKW